MMARALSWRPEPRRGTVAVVVAICLMGLMAVLAITVDGGGLLAERRHAQATADAAAMAAATCLYTHYPQNGGNDPNGDASEAAYAIAAGNGYTNDGTHSTVQVNIPPSSGAYSGKSGYAEVIVVYQQRRAFSNVLGSGTLPVRARAVARGAWVAPNMGVLVLDYSGKGTLSDQGNGAATESGAPIIVNSNNQSAAMDTGNGIMKAPEFDITGGYSISGGGQMITNPVPNNILTGVHPTPDPLAYLPVPSQPSVGTITKVSLSGGGTQYTLTPGSYGGPGPNLPNFGNGDVVIFQQASAGNDGLYYLNSGGLNSQGASLTMDSSTTGGIMIYNAGTGTNDKINITGNSSGTVNLSPRTDGVYSGMTFFQARNASEDMQISGNGSFTIYGTIYSADGLLKVTGNGTVSNIGSQYVTKDLSISGNGNVSITYTGNPVAKTRIITLVE
jgi:Flp pilus assembly protein TadG